MSIKPFIGIFTFISSGFIRLLGGDPKASEPFITEEELRTMVGVSEEEGVLEDVEKEMIFNVFDFADSQAKDVMVQRVDIVAVDSEATYEEAAAEYRNLAKTTTQKEVADVQTLRKGLDEMNWLDTSVKEMSSVDRARVYRDYISPLEDLRNFKLSTEDKRTVRNLRDLTALGHKAGTELTPDETGLLDNSLNQFKKYIFDEVGGKKATSSYETFRNIFRNALYGASLTQAEIQAFNKAAGTLGQQFQPVMAQLQTQMETIKSNLESIRDLNDPDIAHYYLGAPIEDIDDAIMAIEERLNDPRLRLGRAAKGREVKVQRVQQDAKPVPPDVNGKDQNPTFDFDAAMKEAGL